jgi:hypothetical protein
MRREILTERDIEDLFQQGKTSLELREDIMLTTLAYEKANQLGMQLLNVAGDTSPAAPIRPYLSRIPPDKPAATAAPRVQNSQITMAPPAIQPPPVKKAAPDGLGARIRAAVATQMGSQVDPQVLDQIIQRVLMRTGLK